MKREKERHGVNDGEKIKEQNGGGERKRGGKERKGKQSNWEYRE